MITLGIETSAAVAAVALVRDGQEVRSLSLPDCLGRHAEETLPLLERLLSECGYRKSDIDRVVVGTGPGSFTGVRVGLSMAIGISLGLGCDALGLPSLLSYLPPDWESVERQCGEASLHYLVRDARRDELFVMLLPAGALESPQSLLEKLAKARQVSAVQRASFFQRLGNSTEKSCLVGDLPADFPTPPGATLVPREPSAVTLARLGSVARPSDYPLQADYVRGTGATPQHLPPSPLELPRT